MNLAGNRYGRLFVIGRDEYHEKGKGIFWTCLCDCGRMATKKTGELRDRSRHNQSCGCARRESIRKASAAAWRVTTKYSGPYKKPLKVMFSNMYRRCYVPTARRFERYGGRGIKICDEWIRERAAFYRWAASSGYRPGMSIDRIDYNGNYCPSNCRFVPLAEQAGNTSRNVLLNWDGLTLTLAQWARRLHVRPQALQHRVARGWDTERIFTQPFRRSA